MSSIITGANPLLNLVGYGVGSALGPILRPPIQDLLNEAWELHPVRPLGVETAAAMAVEGVWTPAQAQGEARLTGFDSGRLNDLMQLIDDPPAFAELLALWRREYIDGVKFTEGLKHHRIETDYFDGLRRLKIDRLDPSVIANAVQQGHMPPGDILPSPVTGDPPFHIPLTQIDLDPHDEAAASGIDDQRLRVMANLVGLPPGDMELLHMWNRGIIDEASVDGGIREGHRKTKWIPAVKQLRHAVISATQAVDLRVRGWIDDGEMERLGAKTGYSAEQMHRLFQIHGRPISFRQVFIGERRGGEMGGPVGDLSPAFLKALQESNIRPEWYNLAWAQRETLPSAFVLRSLTQSGDIEQADALRLLLFMGWPEWLAEKVSVAWAVGGTAEGKEQTKAELLDEYQGGFMSEPELRAALTALGWKGAELDREVHLADARRVKSQRDAAITFLRGLFVKGKIDAARATTDLGRLGVVSEAVGRIVEIWTLEREAVAA